MDRPRFWLLAGPNGSGKSTFAATDIFERLTQTPERGDPLTKLNADVLARSRAQRRSKLTEDERALRAAQDTDSALDDLLAQGKSALVETVLSTDKHLARVMAARARGYWIGLIYVLLRDPDLNVRRVKQRAAQGGHDVDPAKVRARWTRSLDNLPAFARFADALTIWDNTSPERPAALLIEATPTGYYVSPQALNLIRSTRTRRALRAALHQVIADLKRA